MTAMNNLIEGKPQSVQSGALLLALSAWHLYPDISVQSTSLQFIKQADPLVGQGGIITVGLQNRTNHSDDGVYWSLPLAHLRAYGKPVVTTGHNGISHTQITFSQFLCVTLGSLFRLWHILEEDRDVAAEIVCRLAQMNDAFTINFGKQGYRRRPTSGLGILGRAAQLYLSSKGSLRDEYVRLFAYGRRRCSTFLAEKQDNPLQFFGLANFPIAFSVFFEDEHGTARDRHVDYLREWAHKRGIDLTGLIICYRNKIDQFSCTSVYENQTSGKSNFSSAQISLHQPKLHWGASGIEHEKFSASEEPTSGALPAVEEQKSRFLSPAPREKPILHDFMYGDPSIAAIYRPSKTRYQTEVEDNCLRPKELLELLQDGSVSDSVLLQRIDMINAASYGILHSLQALEFAGRIYAHLDDAKIDMRICSSNLYASHYALRLQALDHRIGTEGQDNSDTAMVNLKLAFSCIILFQTGRIDIDPEHLEGAMAISYNDSIFVAQSILADPSHSDSISPVRRIVGNVGKPGLAILIPPNAPEVRERSLGDWRVVNHAPFDGKYENNFRSTSLHLAFTGSMLPIDVGDRGSLTHEAHFVETVISVYEAGEWVADLDVLKAISHYKHGWIENAKTVMKITLPPLVSIDNWQEILDNPERSAVVRACGNEQARLAIVTVASQLGYRFRIIQPDNHPEYKPGLENSPWISERHENAENDSKGALHDGPEALQAMADLDPRIAQGYNGDNSESQYEFESAELSPLSEQFSLEDGTYSQPSSMNPSEQINGHQHVGGVLYIC